MIYELRIYEAVAGKMKALHDRFASHTLNLFKRHGMKSVGYWTDEIGTSNRLTYILAFESLADREAKWAAFRKDPEWVQVLAETEKDGPLTARVNATIMRPTSYSPMR